MNYKVWDQHQMRSGTAEQILLEITKKENGMDTEVSHMTVDQYADALIGNAPYYVPKDVLDELAHIPFETKYDQALTLLGNMPASNLRILTTERNGMMKIRS